MGEGELTLAWGREWELTQVKGGEANTNLGKREPTQTLKRGSLHMGGREKKKNSSVLMKEPIQVNNSLKG